MERPFKESAALAKAIVWEVIGNHMPVGTWLQRTQTSEGNDAIRIVIVFPEARAAEVTSDQLVRIMSEVRARLPGIGEDRAPIVSFARMEDEDELRDAQFSASA